MQGRRWIMGAKTVAAQHGLLILSRAIATHHNQGLVARESAKLVVAWSWIGGDGLQSSNGS